MSVHTTFPDAIVFPDGTIRLVTVDAKSWAYSNTDIKDGCTVSTVPDYDVFTENVPQMMSDAGLVVKRKRMPVSHYRSKRIRWPKSTVSDDAKVIDFLQRIPEQYRQDAGCRAHAHQRQRNHRMQEAAKRCERRKELQDGQTNQ